jgi:hypothetical protein
LAKDIKKEMAGGLMQLVAYGAQDVYLKNQWGRKADC